MPTEPEEPAAAEPDEQETGALEIHGLEDEHGVVEGEYVEPDEPEDHPYEPGIADAEVVWHDESDEYGDAPDPGERVDDADDDSARLRRFGAKTPATLVVFSPKSD